MIGDNVVFMTQRSIAGFIPNVIVEERHEDYLGITEHPVEQGAEISDHAYKMPARLRMRVFWNNGISSLLSAVQNPVQNIGNFGNLFANVLTTVRDVYEALLVLQESRQVFDVVTGKRSYKNMLLERLEVITDEDSENVLEVIAQFQQVIIVSTQVISLKGLNPQGLANPQSAAQTVKKGAKQLVTTPEGDNVLSRMGYYGVPLP